MQMVSRSKQEINEAPEEQQVLSAVLGELLRQGCWKFCKTRYKPVLKDEMYLYVLCPRRYSVIQQASTTAILQESIWVVIGFLFSDPP